MSRFINETLAARRAEGKGALVAYLPIGFPDLAGSIEAVVTVLQNGFDAVELGLPYSDPVMDGGVIQAAARSSLKAGFKIAHLFEAIREIRSRVDAPVLVMTYANPVEKYGVERFMADLASAGGAGVVYPDLTPDTAQHWIQAATAHSLESVFLVAPSSTEARIKLASDASDGFVYAASTMGVTGARKELDSDAERLVSRVRAAHDGPVCVGIGISTAKQVKEVLEYADGAIVGSALVRALSEEGTAGVRRLARELSTTMKGTQGDA